MILILSQAASEFSTQLVMDWLNSFDAHYFLLTGDELLETTQMQFSLNKEIQELHIQDNYGKLTGKEIGIVWFRRQLSENSFQYYEDLACSSESKRNLITYLRKEFQLFYSTLALSFDTIPWLNSPATSDLNKIHALITAKKCGLAIPATVVTNSIDSQIRNSEKKFITKPLTDAVIIRENEKKQYAMLSTLVDNTHIPDEGIIMFPSLLQAYIEKEFEIRVFYLDGTCKSIAIFSQLDKQTEVDFRNYNDEHPNRCVPYKLPVAIELKLRKLMKMLRLKSGSIDIIKTKNEEYVFLEVNPVGQFDWVSFNGNYNIEKDIATYLIKNDLYATKKNKETCSS